MSKTVRAAGGVIVHSVSGSWRVLVTHRPHYDDWSLPKGKRDDGETDEACAVREVLEETGLTVVLHSELPEARYVDHKGRPKVVRYWLMTLDPVEHPHGAPPFEKNDEVDEVQWLEPDAAIEILDYDHDRSLVAQALAAARKIGVVS
jgi:8-oxo-dGTP diphosphatase